MAFLFEADLLLGERGRILVACAKFVRVVAHRICAFHTRGRSWVIQENLSIGETSRRTVLFVRVAIYHQIGAGNKRTVDSAIDRTTGIGEGHIASECIGSVRRGSRRLGESDGERDVRSARTGYRPAPGGADGGDCGGG